MKIAVLGAGAVGCYYGAMLARAGHAVTLVGRAVHVDAVQRQGLLLETRGGQERVAVEASVRASAAQGAGLILFCVKSTDTETAGAALAPHVAPGALVLGMQNGVDNAPRLQALLSVPVVPAAVYVATAMAGPGHVRHHGRGDLVIGAMARSAEIVACFGTAGIAVQVSADVLAALWAKLVINCAYNALSAITQLPYGRLVQGEGVDALMDAIVRECTAVARSDGVFMADTMRDEVRAIAGAMADQVSSTAQDVARRRPSEIDHLNGYVVRRARALGLPAPVNEVLVTLVRLLQSRPAP